MENRSLTDRFAFGSNNLSWYIPGTPQRDFFLGIPERQKQLVDLGKQQVKAQQTALHQLAQQHTEQIYALNEIEYQLRNTVEGIDHLGDRIEDAISHLEESLIVELSEIKWVLGQMDEKLAELVRLVKYRRNTEARELVQDGVKCLARGYYDKAQRCLEKAVQKKETDFQAYTNLGFVHLHKNNSKLAIENFIMAVDFAPPESQQEEASILALENLARAYYASEDFVNAKRIAEKAQELRTRNSIPSNNSDYRYAIYCVLSGTEEEGLKKIGYLCRKKPNYFAVASTDADLISVRGTLLPLLDNLAREAFHKAKAALADAQEAVNKLEAQAKSGDKDVFPESKPLQQALSKANKLLDKPSYSASLESARLSRIVLQISQIAENLPSDRHQLNILQDKATQLKKSFHAAKTDNKTAQKAFHRRNGVMAFFAIIVLTAFELFYVAQDSGVGGAIVLGVILLVMFFMTLEDMDGCGCFGLIIMPQRLLLFIQDREWKPLPKLAKAEAAYNAAIKEADNAQERVKEIETKIEPLLEELQGENK